MIDRLMIAITMITSRVIDCRNDYNVTDYRSTLILLIYNFFS